MPICCGSPREQGQSQDKPLLALTTTQARLMPVARRLLPQSDLVVWLQAF
jgi:hypothetical protein